MTALPLSACLSLALSLFLSLSFSFHFLSDYFLSVHPTKFIGNLYLRAVNYTRRQVLDFSPPRGTSARTLVLFFTYTRCSLPSENSSLADKGCVGRRTLSASELLALQGAKESARSRCVQQNFRGVARATRLDSASFHRTRTNQRR